jgi:diguanylate cyclase (GGDEF)-like protein
VNIDDFTEINDLYGNHAGDRILQQFARKLETMNFDKVYRTSADEYVILKKGEFRAGDAMRFIREVRDSIESGKYFYEETPIDLRVTIGATIEYPPALVEADMAYRMAKRARKPLMIFSSEWNMEKNFRENIHWAREIKSALAEGRIHSYAQPLYDLGKKRIKGYEMLMRLIKEDGTVVPPSFFLSLAQKTHHYPAMTRQIVEESCAFFAERKNVTFSINLSVEDILNEETVEFIKERIEHYHVTDRIIFELLESENIELYPEVEAFVKSMKEMGCQIAIDDFGTGYSNFAYLVKLKVDYIKIDGSLIKNIHTNRNMQIAVETIISFAKKLGVKTVAEFASNEMIYETVESLGIDIIQGYYIDEPKSLKDIEKASGGR